MSFTDHDNIEAGLALQVTADRRRVPLSVEWTVPYERSVFHLGIHNLPRQWMAAMAAYTQAPEETRLPELLSGLAVAPDTLIVLNHPFWMEEGVSEAAHRPALARLLRECGEWIHAFEMNGTRPWRENADTVALADAHSRPVISGGDRHAREPAACLNLTNAATFAEFAAEVRAGESTVVFLPHYRESMAMRILQASWDILRPYPEYPGRERWTDRIFYRGEDGVARPLAAQSGSEGLRGLRGRPRPRWNWRQPLDCARRCGCSRCAAGRFCREPAPAAGGTFAEGRRARDHGAERGAGGAAGRVPGLRMSHAAVRGLPLCCCG